MKSVLVKLERLKRSNNMTRIYKVEFYEFHNLNIMNARLEICAPE